MTERKWTPGPWFVRYHRGETQLVMGDGNVQMCDMTYYPWVPENLADWHLIAAAPDMYEALSNLGNDSGKAMPATAWRLVQDALAKARGES